MCVFLSVAVARFRGDPAQPFRARHLVAESLPAGGESTAALPESAMKLSVGDGHCACSTYKGSVPKPPFDVDAERRRYQREGWSAAKIERAIEAKRLAHERPPRDREHADAFMGAIEELVDRGASVTFIASGEDGSFAVTGTRRMRLTDFLDSRGSYPQNTVIDIETR